MEQDPQPPRNPDRDEQGRETARPDEAPAHEPAPVDLASESAAGEEDPGAAIDQAIVPPSDPTSGPKR